MVHGIESAMRDGAPEPDIEVCAYCSHWDADTGLCEAKADGWMRTCGAPDASCKLADMVAACVTPCDHSCADWEEAS